VKKEKIALNREYGLQAFWLGRKGSFNDFINRKKVLTTEL